MLVVVGLYPSLQLPLSLIQSNNRWCLCARETHRRTHKRLITGLVPFRSNQKVGDASSSSLQRSFQSNLMQFYPRLMIVNRPFESMNYSRRWGKKSLGGKNNIQCSFQWRSDVSQWHSCAHVQRPNDFSWGQIRSLCFFGGVEYCSWWL